MLQPKVEEKTVVSDCGAAFNSRAIRLKDKRTKCPAPGAYEVSYLPPTSSEPDTDQVAKEPFHKMEYGNVCPSSSFTSGVERGKVHELLDHIQLLSHIAKVAEELAAKNAAMPGPSSYTKNEAHKLELHGSGSHMFTGKVLSLHNSTDPSS